MSTQPHDRDGTPASAAGAGSRPLARRDLALIGLGLAVWIALGSTAAWYLHLLTQPREPCRAVDPQTRQSNGATTPGHGLNVLTGQGRCS